MPDSAQDLALDVVGLARAALRVFEDHRASCRKSYELANKDTKQLARNQYRVEPWRWFASPHMLELEHALHRINRRV